MNQFPKLWLNPDEVAPIIGCDAQAIYRDIRENQFPFEFVRIGKRIKISARSLGLVSSEAKSNEAEKTCANAQ